MKTRENKKNVTLIVADISGYTRFLLNDKVSEVHGHIITAQLLKSIIKKVRLPLKVSKLEGDAVFMYAVRPQSEGKWKKQQQMIRDRLEVFYDVFNEKLHKLIHSNTCECNACQNMSELGLKIIIHYGMSDFFRVARFSELSGKDVILVHRLLKNSISEKNYILLTAPAREMLGFSDADSYEAISEDVADFGAINIYVRFFREKPIFTIPHEHDANEEKPAAFIEKALQKVMLKTSVILYRLKLKKW